MNGTLLPYFSILLCTMWLRGHHGADGLCYMALYSIKDQIIYMLMWLEVVERNQ